MRSKNFLMAVILVSYGCSIEPMSPKSSEQAGADAEGAGAGMSSLAAFEQSVYPLVREQTCVGCHTATVAPFLAAENVEEAHDAVVNGNKVDLKNPENSRLFLRLAQDNHNCWDDCSANAVVMQAAIEKWAALMAGAADQQDLGIQTESLLITDVVEKEGSDDAGTIVLEAESGAFTGPMAAANNAGASGGRYIAVPNGNGGQLQANSPNAGIAVYTIDVAEAGSYMLWGLVNTPTAADNSFFVRLDQGAFQQWRMGVTAAAFQWDLASDQDNGGTTLQFQLTAGAHRLEVRQREDGTGVDMLALTNDPGFNGGQAGGSVIKVLRFDISGLVDLPGAFFEIETEEFDAFSYKFKNPAIVLKSGEVIVKDVRIVINDVFNPQNATYTIVDTAVNAPGAILSTAALIIPKDKGVDEDMISVAFGEIKSKK